MNVEVVVADITKMDVDVIVNAANPSLVPGGGVCGAIHRAAGPQLAEECATFNMGVHTGMVAVTHGYDLPAMFVVHAVGPVFDEKRESVSRDLLEQCYENSLNAAEGVRARTVAFPAISTGIYGYPMRKAAWIAWDVIDRWRDQHPTTSIDTVYLVAFDEEAAKVLSLTL